MKPKGIFSIEMIKKSYCSTNQCKDHNLCIKWEDKLIIIIINKVKQYNKILNKVKEKDKIHISPSQASKIRFNLKLLI